MFIKKFGYHLFAAVIAVAGTAFIISVAYAPITSGAVQAMA